MPALANKRHETFAQRLAVGWSNTAAYREIVPTASDKTAAESGSRLSKNVKIVTRVAEITAPALQRLEITATDIARVAWDIATDAENGPGPRVAALSLLAKRHPEFSEKHDVNMSLRGQVLQLVASMDTDALRNAKSQLA